MIICKIKGKTHMASLTTLGAVTNRNFERYLTSDFPLFIRAPCHHPILILEIKANNQIERIRSMTAWGTVSKPQLTAWGRVNLQLLRLLEEEGREVRGTQLRGNSIIASLSYSEVLLNVDTKSFSSLLNILIKYLEANYSPQSVSEMVLLCG